MKVEGATGWRASRGSLLLSSTHLSLALVTQRPSQCGLRARVKAERAAAAAGTAAAPASQSTVSSWRTD